MRADAVSWACSSVSTKGVLLRAQADDLDWIARELARLPFDFSVRSPGALRAAIARTAQRLAQLAGQPLE